MWHEAIDSWLDWGGNRRAGEEIVKRPRWRRERGLKCESARVGLCWAWKRRLGTWVERGVKLVRDEILTPEPCFLKLEVLMKLGRLELTLTFGATGSISTGSRLEVNCQVEMDAPKGYGEHAVVD